jgi:site-specific DNA recombinase
MSMYADGAGYKKIAYALNSESVPSPSGGDWNANTLHYILFRNQNAYLGIQIYNREDNSHPGVKEKPKEEWTVNPNAWEPILTLEEIAAVNEKRGNTKRRYARDGSDNKSSNPFILTGKMVCGICGAAVTGATGGRKSQSWRYYRCCRSKSAGPSACNLGAIAQWKAEGAVIQAIKDYFINPEFISDVLKEFRNSAETNASDSKARVDELTKAIDRKEQKRQRLISMTIKGILPEEDARPFMAKIIDDLASLRKELASHKATQGFDFDGHAASAEEFRKDVEGILELGNTGLMKG